MQVDHQWQNKFIITSLIGELDTPATEETWSQIHEMLDFDPRGVVLDLSRCTYIASVGITLIIRLMRELRAQHIPMRLSNPSPALRLVLDVVNLPSLIPLDATIDESLIQLEGITRSHAA